MKVGDYVRIVTLSGQGRIAKLEKINDICTTDNGAVDKNNIIKTSPNIIDLIEVGDYVNGKEIEQIIDNELYFDTNDMAMKISFKNEDIKSIVTKEMYSNVEYRVENN